MGTQNRVSALLFYTASESRLLAGFVNDATGGDNNGGQRRNDMKTQ